MAHADIDRPTLEQPTVAFHQQPTVVVGPNDLAREIFRQCGSTTVKRAVSATSAAPWVTAPKAPSASRGPLRGALVCIACLFLGIGAGHAFREGRAYAGELHALGGASLARHAAATGATEARVRPTRTAASVGAHGSSSARAKEPALSPPVSAASAGAHARPGRGTERRHAGPRAASVRPPPPVSMDALFLDFEPAFRVVP